jgi:hypothetical protein
MLDSVNINDIPTDKGASIIAYYVDLTTSGAVSKRFPGLRQNPIDRHGNSARIARSFDVEEGLIRPSQLEQIIAEFNATNPTYRTGARAEIYCNRSTIPAVRVGTGKYVLGRDYYLWVATLDGTEYTGPGVNACQIRDFGGYDESVVYDSRFLP